jgi:hypothetical protein
MRLAFPVAIAIATLSAALGAQDTKVRSRTNIKGDDATVTSMSGCLRQELATGVYILDGTSAATGKEIETNTRVKTDVDNDKTTVKGKSETKASGAVATGGSDSTFLLVPGNGVELAPHVGEQVQISAIMVKAGHGDADVKIKEKTKVDPEDAPDTKSRSKTKLELPRTAAGQYTVLALTPTGRRCAE